MLHEKVRWPGPKSSKPDVKRSVPNPGSRSMKALGTYNFAGDIGKMSVPAAASLMLVLHFRRRWKNPEAEAPAPRWFGPLMGLFAGITTMVANAAGPVMTLYLLAMRLPKMEFLVTSAAFFLLINWIKVPFIAQLGLIN